MDGWNTTFLLGRPIFRGYVSFREGILKKQRLHNQFPQLVIALVRKKLPQVSDRWEGLALLYAGPEMREDREVIRFFIWSHIEVVEPKGLKVPIEQWKNLSCLGYIGDYTKQLNADYNQPL